MVMGDPSYLYKKEERLKGKKRIADLFENGQALLSYPVKVVFIEINKDDATVVKAGFSVSRKNFRHAVDRNLLKRRMREAYRLNKPAFYIRLNDKLFAMMFIYVAKEILPYAIIEKGIKNLLNKLS